MIAINKKNIEGLNDAFNSGEGLVCMRVAANQVHGLRELAERTKQKGPHCVVSATELSTWKVNADYVGSGRRKTAEHAECTTFEGADLHHLFRAERSDYVGKTMKLRRNLPWINQIVRERKSCNSLRFGLETEPKHNL